MAPEQDHDEQGQDQPVALAHHLATLWGGMSAEERKACTTALRQGGVFSEPDPSPPRAAPAAGAGLGGVSELTQRLEELSAMLTPEERAQLETKLKQSGFFRLPSDSGGSGGSSWKVPATQSDFFREFFASQQDAELDGPRLSDLSAALAGLAHSLDQLAWSSWKRIAPRSELRRGEPLGRMIGEYASGQAGDLQAIKAEIERLRQLVASLVTAISQVGHFAHRKLQELRPDLIESSMGEQGERACWRRYKEIVGAFDEDELEADMLASIADYAESMLRDVMSKP